MDGGYSVRFVRQQQALEQWRGQSRRYVQVFKLTCNEFLAGTCFPSIRMLVRLEVILATSRSKAYDARSTNTMALTRIDVKIVGFRAG